jgi:hypothetical protein
MPAHIRAQGVERGVDILALLDPRGAEAVVLEQPVRHA